MERVTGQNRQSDAGPLRQAQREVPLEVASVVRGMGLRRRSASIRAAASHYVSDGIIKTGIAFRHQGIPALDAAGTLAPPRLDPHLPD